MVNIRITYIVCVLTHYNTQPELTQVSLVLSISVHLQALRVQRLSSRLGWLYYSDIQDLAYPKQLQGLDIDTSYVFFGDEFAFRVHLPCFSTDLMLTDFYFFIEYVNGTMNDIVVILHCYLPPCVAQIDQRHHSCCAIYRNAPVHCQSTASARMCISIALP